MSKLAATSSPIHDLLAARWSPRAFDLGEPPSDEQLERLFEAARWSPSSGNGQPWRFLVARHGSATFETIVENLTPGNRAWAPQAPVLVVGWARIERDGKPFPIGVYDLGQSVATLTLQASAEDLHVHQMGGFLKDGMADAFSHDPEFRPTVVFAIGRAGDPSLLPDDLASREGAPRTRRPLAETVFAEAWGQPAPFVQPG
jgi:nitroreductase